MDEKGRDEEWEAKCRGEEKNSVEVEEQRRHGGGGRMKRMKTSAGRGVLFKNRGFHLCRSKEAIVLTLELPEPQTERGGQGLATK